MTMFCPKCGALLVPKKQKSKRVMACPACKYVDKKAEGMSMVDTMDEKNDVEIVDEQQDMETLPEIKEKCPKCGNEKARYWVVQTRASDEAPTKFIKCEKCAHTWRDYS
jgi:DNA-directed RNA polymerase subunit M